MDKNIVSVHIDKNSLPSDGQFVRWQTLEDVDFDIWKEGIFCEDAKLFCGGFNESHSEWDSAYNVVHWEGLLNETDFDIHLSEFIDFKINLFNKQLEERIFGFKQKQDYKMNFKYKPYLIITNTCTSGGYFPGFSDVYL